MIRMMSKGGISKLRDNYICECGKVISKPEDISFVKIVDPRDAKKNQYLKYGQDKIKLVMARNGEINASYQGNVYRKKCCASCKNPLPMSVGVSRCFKVAFFGEKSAGKTVTNIVQTILLGDLAKYHAALKEHISVDLEAYGSELNQRFMNQVTNFKKGKLPDPTPPLKRCFHLWYQVRNQYLKTSCGLLVADCFGEIGNQTLAQDNGIYEKALDAIFFAVDGEGLCDAKRIQYNVEYINNVFATLSHKAIPVYIIVTKADRLLSNETMAAHNSLSKKTNGEYVSKHENGFREDVYADNRKLAMTLLSQKASKIMDAIEDYVPRELIFPFVVSSYNPDTPIGEYTFFCSEQPMLHLLHRISVFPTFVKGGV